MNDAEFERIKDALLNAAFRADDALCRARDELEGMDSGRGCKLAYVDKQIDIASAAVQKVLSDLRELCDGSLTARIIDAQLAFSRLA